MDRTALEALHRVEIRQLAKANGISANLKTTEIIDKLVKRYPSGVPRIPSKRPDRKKRSHNPSPAALPPGAIFALRTPQPVNGVQYESASGAPRRPLPSPLFTPDPSPLAAPLGAVPAPFAPAPAAASRTNQAPNPEQASAAGPSVAPLAGAEPAAGPSVQPAAQRTRRISGPHAERFMAWVNDRTHGANDGAVGVGADPQPQPASVRAQPNGAEAEPARPPSAASSGLYSYRSYQSSPDIVPEPASVGALKRAVRSMRAISEKNGARYAESQVMRKSAERQLREIQALRRLIAAEKAMRIRAMQYLTYWQNKGAYWTEEEMYDPDIRTRQAKNGDLYEVPSDEEPMDDRAPLELSKGQKSEQGKQMEDKQKNRPNQPKDQAKGQTKQPRAGKGSKKADIPPQVDPAILQRMANVINPSPEVNNNGKRSRDGEHPDEVEEVRKPKKSRTLTAGQDQAGPSVNGVVKIDKGKGRIMSPVPEDEDEDLKDSESVMLLLGIMLSDDSEMQEEAAAGPKNTGVVSNQILPDEPVRAPVFRPPTRAERAAAPARAPSQRRQSSRQRGAHKNRV